MRAYGVDAPLSTVELDHLEPVSLGGASTVANLWPETWDGPEGAHVKDRLELHTPATSESRASRVPIHLLTQFVLKV